MESVQDNQLEDFAYYYPESHWVSGETSDWVKSLLLFFDGVATLIPGANKMRALDADPTLTGPLLDQGLLRQLEPATLIDQDAIALLAELVIQYVKDNNVRNLNPNSSEARTFISLARFGFMADERVSSKLHAVLKKRSLAGEPGSVSVSIDPTVRGIILCLWSQILRIPGRRLGLDLMPVTDQGKYVEALMNTLRGVKSELSAASVVKLDLEKVSINLGSVPLDELLDFRRQHGTKYRAYRRFLNEQVARLSIVDDEQRTILLRDRAEQIDDIAADLNRGLRTAFTVKNAGSFALGMVGTALGIATHNYFGAALGASSSLWSIMKEPDSSGSFSYLFEAQKQFAAR